jgi:cellulose synthase/poly-beta-1,6-N-acetylglucosamine synthase-like glycosyltransferase
MNSFIDGFLTSGLLYYSFAYTGAILLIIIRNQLTTKAMIWLNYGLFIFIWFLTAALTALLNNDLQFTVIHLFYLTIVIIPFWAILPRFHQAGRYFMVTNYLLYFFALFWGIWFVLTMPVSGLTRSLILLGLPMLAVSLPVTLVQFFEQFEILCHRNWQRPRDPLHIDQLTRFPKVSLHVPSHAEPPEIVIETLNKLSQLDYPNFEVLLIDNNTDDESLWKPVKEHCEKLGNVFRFIRLTEWPGAKAGALNYAITQTASDAEIVGIIDADYQAHPMFLKTLVGYFYDPTMGFVQTPHDYRDFKNNAFLSHCYFEYEWFFRTQMVSLNERNSGITVGTMCLIRKDALVKAGGWSEWCLTEDSELAIRIHALGYNSIYTKTSLGRGLIPETFEGYKKQRFRWTAGPIQELKHHFKLLFPFGDDSKSSLTFIQRIEHMVHGLQNVTIGLSSLLIPLNIAVVLSMLYHREYIEVPLVLYISATVLVFSSIILSFYIYRKVVGATFTQTIGGLIASMSLAHVISTASISALFTNNFAWHRTNKFKESPALFKAFQATLAETLIGVTTLITSCAMFLWAPKKGVIVMIIIGLFLKGATYLTAPYMAWLANRELAAK